MNSTTDTTNNAQLIADLWNAYILRCSAGIGRLTAADVIAMRRLAEAVGT